MELQEHLKHLTLKEKIERMVEDKRFDLFIIYLVIIYTLLIFIYFALDNQENRKNEDVVTTLSVVQYIEMVILIIFTFEIFFRVVAATIKV
jgi:hypothetical protein